MKFSFIKYFILLNILLLLTCYHANSKEKGTGRINLAEKGHYAKPFDPAIMTNNIATTLSNNIVTLTPMQAQSFTNNIPAISSPQYNTSDLASGTIRFKAWVQYFKYSDCELSATNTPTMFYENKEYSNQIKSNPNVNLNEVDQDRTLKYIKLPTYFWLTVFDNYLNILTCKQVLIL
jgi:hypothetical protein